MTCCVQGAVVAAASGPTVVELVYGQLHSSHGGLPLPTAAGAWLNLFIAGYAVVDVGVSLVQGLWVRSLVTDADLLWERSFVCNECDMVGSEAVSKLLLPQGQEKRSGRAAARRPRTRSRWKTGAFGAASRTPCVFRRCTSASA
jgi:hypothetical protein